MKFQDRVSFIKDLGFRSSALDSLQAYIELLWTSNKELNLISRQMTFEELIDNHVIDCLLPLKYFPLQAKCVADFGAGGGLPGVIYALQFPQMTFQLFEKSPKKQEFLSLCRKLAPNLEIKGEIPTRLEKVDLVISRAFKPLDVILEMSRDYYLRGGSYFILKARREKIEEELLLARKKFKDLEISVTPLKSPLLEVERNLVSIN